MQTLIDDYAAPELTTSHPLLLITLNGWQEYPDGEVVAGGRVRYFSGWRPEWLVSSVRRKAYDEIGESVSAWWRVNPDVVRQAGIEHVVAVHRGVTRALFRIEPGSWETRADGFDKDGRRTRRQPSGFGQSSRGHCSMTSSARMVAGFRAARREIRTPCTTGHTTRTKGSNASDFS